MWIDKTSSPKILQCYNVLIFSLPLAWLWFRRGNHNTDIQLTGIHLQASWYDHKHWLHANNSARLTLRMQFSKLITRKKKIHKVQCPLWYSSGRNNIMGHLFTAMTGRNAEDILMRTLWEKVLQFHFSFKLLSGDLCKAEHKQHDSYQPTYQGRWVWITG